MRRTALLLAALAALGAVPSAPSAAGDRVFFREPDRDTARRIDELITQFAYDAPATRRRARAELESLGGWSVGPLLAAAGTQDNAPQVRCASVLTLAGIGDRRAVVPLRDVLVREDSNPYVGGFAALALGRFRDGAACDAFRRALGNPRELPLLRAAVPLALAKLRTPQALDLLREQLTDTGATEPVNAARILALGFFPEAALAASGDRPGPVLDAALQGASRRRGERQAAVLAFLAATARARSGKEFLLGYSATEQTPQVEYVTLLGLAAFDGPDVTARLCRSLTGGAPDALKERACELLIGRGDATAVPPLLQAIRAQSSSPRLRACAVLALGGIDTDEARRAVVERFGSDRAPLVRAASAVAAARSSSKSLREEMLGRIGGRLQAGEPDTKAREVMSLAVQVLGGERRDVTWPEAGPEALFGTLGRTLRQRLLREINRRAELSLDLGKILDVPTDDAFTPYEPPAAPPEFDRGQPLAGVPDGGSAPTPAPAPTPAGGTIGAARTSDWSELRDLASDVARRPYFGDDDLPAPMGAVTAPK